MSAPKRVDLSALSANRRKRGRVANHDPKMVAEIQSLKNGEALNYAEANTNSEAFAKELAQELPKITKVTGDETESVAVFQNRWLSRYRQRARSLWEFAGLPADEFDFVVLSNGEIFIGRK
jgi:transposase-like protein